MRLSNQNKIKKYFFIGTLHVIILGIGITGFLVDKYQVNLLGKASWLLLIIPILLIIIFLLRGRPIFEYDSDGEILNFKNRNILPVLGEQVYDEIPKYKLIRYEIINFFYIKRLYISISSKNSNIIILTYHISYLTREELENLTLSLNKVVEHNKKT
ncbi:MULTISPECIES: hypothetical protein [unclassified Chryseobacterium]|uniref:hypothetical protein n=1 Tax=unclassified Chryseobacterium TaxID=2593645 RepID=UPI000F44C1AD|nr:hypothetical protein [Chryseobacterium sp. G0240]ROI04787.1 hypothetical protein EGI16_09010 [Chryseobacterium sp. G0240]